MAELEHVRVLTEELSYQSEQIQEENARLEEQQAADDDPAAAEAM